MKQYTLWNVKDNKSLKHPTIGVWRTYSKTEALSALSSLISFLNLSKISYDKDNFIVKELEN